ncbi:uncharacterized protein EAE97_005181 [Botrytis byssoidea]|uniref:Phosphoglycerate mutase-like protein n=1 Tax=Botrytis byssoidea TaxID=139641 RepID=A0A9P5IM95_9HELO|nr:uncharacterized protein EAE97_005181 [Botrytis byssoidea]KAF7944548.1 hypothetical protein EAE97_005181 [Botrytis byssoidea]
MVLCFPFKQYFSHTEIDTEPRTFIHLVRHGEAYHNLGHINGKINPRSYNIKDPYLTRKGIEQAKSTREQRTKCCPVPNIVLTSPLIRTLETTLHIFPFADDGSIYPQPQIVAYDDLRESGAYLCNVRQTTLDLANNYEHKGVDFTALPPIAPPMKSTIRTKQRADIVRIQIMDISKLIKKGGGFWKGVYIQGTGQNTGPRMQMKQDVHIVVVSHGSFMEYLLPLSHTIQPSWRRFKPAEMRTYEMDEDGHLDKIVEFKRARRTTILRKVSLILTSSSD